LRRVHTKRNAHVAINSEGVLCAEEAREPGWRGGWREGGHGAGRYERRRKPRTRGGVPRGDHG
jgi:hypothetical protein